MESSLQEAYQELYETNEKLEAEINSLYESHTKLRADYSELLADHSFLQKTENVLVPNKARIIVDVEKLDDVKYVELFSTLAEAIAEFKIPYTFEISDGKAVYKSTGEPVAEQVKSDEPF